MSQQLDYRLTYISSILFFLIPIALITGPFIPDLFLVIIILNFLTILYINKNLKILRNKYLIFFILFCLISTVISTFSMNLSSIKSSSSYIRFGLFIFAVYMILKSNNNIFKNLFYMLFFIYITLFLDSLFQLFFLKNIFGFVYDNSQNFRITSFFGENEILGSYVARLFPLVLFLLVYNSNNFSYKKKIIYALILIITSFTIILLSGERTSIALFFLCIMFISFSSKELRKILVIPIISIVFIALLTFSYSDKVKNRVITTTINQLGLSSKSERIVMFSKVYESHYKISFNMFKEKPLFGHGAKMFRFYCSKKENFVAPGACTTHPHNFYAQMLAELGLFGFISLFSIFILVIFFFIKNIYAQVFNKKQILTDEAICLLSCCFITLFPLLPSGNFFNNWLSVIMYYPLGFLIYIIKENKFHA